MSVSLVKKYGELLGIFSSSVLKIAEETYRMIEVKCPRSSLSSSLLVVMALHIASIKCSIPVDKKEVVKLSGMKSIAYNMKLHHVQQCIDPSHNISSISSLAVSCQLTQAVDFATQIATEYQSKLDQSQSMQASLLNSAALYAAAKALKLKADKDMMLIHSGVARKVFDRLVTFLNPISIQLASKQKMKTKTKKPELETMVEEQVQIDAQHKKRSYFLDDDEREENYYVWKARILENAKKKLLESQE